MQDLNTPMQSRTDALDPARACALQSTLGLDQSIEMGSPLPPFFHQIYFWDAQPPSALGRDGHLKTGELIPDMGLPRRMWAAGRLRFLRPLVAGIQAERKTSVEGVARKQGRTGQLAFVTLRHDYYQRHSIALTEWQEIAYREDHASDAPAPEYPVARTDEEHKNLAAFDSLTLFRYSALTFNGHRIHYDRGYARQIEGYAGLVVHGPLLAQLLMLQAEQRKGAPLEKFTYRATAPVFENTRVAFCWNGNVGWIRREDGTQAMVCDFS